MPRMEWNNAIVWFVFLLSILTTESDVSDPESSLKIEIWDSDYLSKDDFIDQVQISLRDLVKEVKQTGQQIVGK